MADTPKPRKQEQESAGEDVTEVAPGVLRSQLPISMPGLGHVNMYILEDDRGVAVVDPGLPTKESWVAINDRLGKAGVPLSRVHTVVVTHSHPDHFGGAFRLHKETGCEIVAHDRFRVIWDPTEPPDHSVEDEANLRGAMDPEHPGRSNRPRLPWEPTPWGGQGMTFPWKRRMQIKLVRTMPRLMRLPRPTVRLADNGMISLAGREWMALHTPGHTEDHLCLFDPEGGLMLSGDHVLPTITPHISGLMNAGDPLRLFFESLDKVARFGPQVTTVLPAHGHPFSDLAGRANDIKVHHEGRLQRLRDASVELAVPADVMTMSTFLFSPRVLGPMADSETYAHLEHLRLAGEMTRREEDGVYQYALAD